MPEKQDKMKGESGKRSPRGKQGNSGGGNITSKVTLSGLLNFTYGLWSCLGNERSNVHRQMFSLNSKRTSHFAHTAKLTSRAAL